MKLEKAIEILKRHPIELKTAQDHDFFAALLLGIEALKLVKKCRHSPNSWFVKELPGETNE